MKQPTNTLFKRFYFPGMISLICLPLLCIGYFAYTTGFKQLAAMDVVWLDDSFVSQFNFDKMYAENKNPKLIFTGDRKHNESLLSSLDARCKKLLKEKRYNEGAVVVFTNAAKYEDLVNVLDIGNGFNDRISCVPYSNKVFFLLPKPFVQQPGKDSKMPMAWSCGTSDAMTYKPEQSFMDKSSAFAARFWPSITVFLMMIFFSIRSQRKLAVN
jgi:hypothetical protein